MDTNSDNNLNIAFPEVFLAETGEVSPQIQNRLLHLAGQIEQLQAQLESLATDSQQNSSLLAGLMRRLTDPQSLQIVHERLSEVIVQLDANREQLESLTDKLAGVASQDQVGQLARAVANQEQLAELADTLKKLSRTQFKTNTLGETREQQIENALSTLQGIIERREEIREQQPLRDRQRLEELRVEARGELAADFLPALDSLELALESGASLLAKYRQEVAGWDKVQSEATVQEKPTPPSGFWQKIRRQLAAPGEYPSAPVLPEPQPKPPLPQSLVEMADVVEAWLKGLALVQERFLALLANEEIQLILAHHQPFDPRLHVALETETREDMPPNTVVRVLRKGYRQRDRILRYAEVVVSRASTQPEIRSEIRSIENAQNVEKTEPEL